MMGRASEAFTPLQLAYMALQREGKTREEAGAILVAEQGDVQALAARMAEEIDRQAEAVVREAFEASPDGRRAAYKALLEAEEAREQDVEGGQAILRSQGIDTEGMTDDDILRSTGLAPKLVHEMSFAEREAAELRLVEEWDSLDGATRTERARELGLDSHTVESARHVLAGTDEGGEGQ